MFPLAYNTNGLRNMPLEDAIREVSGAGYDGIELSLHSSHLHPLKCPRKAIDGVKRVLRDTHLYRACVAAGAADLLGDEPFEPSLISPEKKQRRRRVDLIRAAVELAHRMSFPVVNFASGIIKDGASPEKARERLIEGINIILKDSGDVTLAIEPEPDMFIAASSEAIELMEEIDSPMLALNLDIGHVQCCEEALENAVSKAAPYARHMHIEDIKGRTHHHEIPGEGDIDFKAVFRTLKAAGYKNYLSVELYHHADVWRKALTESRRYLLKEMEAS